MKKSSRNCLNIDFVYRQAFATPPQVLSSQSPSRRAGLHQGVHQGEGPVLGGFGAEMARMQHAEVGRGGQPGQQSGKCSSKTDCTHAGAKCLNKLPSVAKPRFLIFRIICAVNADSHIYSRSVFVEFMQ
ncbi:hypothetical protein [Delftia sp. UME58]|uniref:hypothetical protein n=1 Tax=Delftia sp. UME58 TaxID=1862322 RepID=UPI0015FF60D4|nr:hypothetical protein [Delftia sp. UME58]